jgi:hypothetical protein
LGSVALAMAFRAGDAHLLLPVCSLRDLMALELR